MESPEILHDYTSLSAQDVGYSIQQLHEDVETFHIEQVPEDVEPFLTQEIPINVEASPDVIPKVGMRFNTEEEIYGFVNQYAYQVGFGISKASVRNEGDRKYYKLRCGKGGVHIPKPESTRTKLSRKTGCKAKVNVIVHGDGRCIISRVFLEHNHILSPKKSRYEQSHKEINAYTKGRLELNDYAGIPLNKNFHSLAVEAKEMSSARCSNELEDDEVRGAKKLKMVLVDDLQTKTDEQLVELISMNKRNAGLLELVLPNKAQALKEAIKSYEDELHRRTTNLSHSPKKTSPQLDNGKLVIKVEVGDQENSSDVLFIPEEERAESREKIGTNVVEPPKVPDFSTQQTVKVNIPKELKQKQTGRKLWVEAEETLLAMAFIHTPEEYVVVGSSQQSNMCWNRFLSYFNQNNTSGIRRNEDQIRSKWRNMNIKIATFNEILTKVMSKRKNGCSDDDVNICARQTYKKEVGTHFTLDHVWNLLKDSPKWKSRFVMDQKTSKSTKPFAKEQTHTSSSSDDDDDDDDDDGSINLEDDEAKRERPSSNKTPKRVEKSKAISSSTSSKIYEAFLQRGQLKDDSFLQLKETLDLRNKLRQEKLKMDAEKIQIQAEKLKNENIAFLLQDASSLTGIDRDIILRRKEEIRNKYSN